MIFHIALPEDWAAAQATGVYTMSTRGVTLEEQGFIHAGEDLRQVELVRSFAYNDLEDLILLVIDESKLDVRVEREAAPGTDEAFPHIYGPLPVGAVVRARPL
jgi:glutathione S-transferase